jgi:hypothetical protein
MFPSVRTRFTSAARRGLEVAVEFATLGEYRLPGELSEPSEPGATAGSAPGGAGIAGGSGTLSGLGAATAGRSRGASPRLPLTAVAVPHTRWGVGPSAEVHPRPLTTRVRPATAAARRQRPERPRERVSPRTGMRALAFDAQGAQARGRVRERAGSARPRPQPCLVGDPGGPGAVSR